MSNLIDKHRPGRNTEAVSQYPPLSHGTQQAPGTGTYEGMSIIANILACKLKNFIIEIKSQSQKRYNEMVGRIRYPIYHFIQNYIYIYIYIFRLTFNFYY